MPQTILIVDDVPTNLQVLGELLRPDYLVRAANSGASALRVATSSPQPDLILLDVMMPDMNGYEVLSRLRENPASRDIPVIFLTALDGEQDEKHGFDLGAVDFISKPIRPAVVAARVKLHLELKRARDALHSSNQVLAERQDRIFRYSQDILCVAGFDGYLKELNPAFTTLLGWSTAQAQQRPWLEFVHPEDIETAVQGQNSLTQGQPLNGLEIRFRHYKGHYRWLSWNAFPVSEENASFCVIRDITEKIYADQQLEAYGEHMSWLVDDEIAKNREKDALLIQQSRLATLGELIHNIAHHWRQPINALGILLANIKDAYEFGELSKEYLDGEVAKGNQLVQRMSTTIDEFRSFFKQDEKKSAFSLKQVAERTLALLSANFGDLKIAICLDADQDVKAYGHPNETSQLLMNLLNNAREAIIAKGVATGTIQVRVASNGHAALLAVRDNAGGIAEEILPKIFTPYFTTKQTGAGLGLYMARMIAANMDGQIEAHNVADGVEFTCSIPLAT